MLSNDSQGRIRVMQEGSQVLKSIAKAMLALGLAVTWFVGTALAVYWMTGDNRSLWLLFAYGMPPALLYFHFQGAQIKTPSLLLLWNVVIAIGNALVAFELMFAAFLLLDALDLG